MVSGATETPLLRLIPLFPLAAALLHGFLLAFLRRPMSRNGVIAVSVTAVFASFVVTCACLARLISLDVGVILADRAYTWIGVGVGAGTFSAELAFQFDALSAVMCMVVTGVGFLIHVYSVGYMDDDHRDDKGFQRFFCYLNLFICAMLLLVLGDNLLVLFLGWEGVGLCSYLLIGFWYSDDFNAYCGSKAFIVNRVGDFGFLLGILLLFWSLAQVGAPTVSFQGIEAHVSALSERVLWLPEWLGGGRLPLLDLIGLCFFLGACGKSAQIPLYVWLPDAMAGPTPVSALIHAATMVTAGVYMVCRLSFLYAEAPIASAVIAWTGGATALLAATIALAQTDIKKVLAYSTVSQLGYMFMAAGCGAYTAAMFHVVTHAFFKALLFLGAGSVILALHHEQDMRKMGGLRQRLPHTWVVMGIAVAAISGVPGFSGFFSKDEILLSAFLAHDIPGHVALWAIGLGTAGLTAFYMMRLFLLTFHGESRVEAGVRSHVEEPSSWVRWPLYLLAALAAVGGFFGLPQLWGDLLGIPNSDSVGNFLLRSVVTPPAHEVDAAVEWALMGGAVAMALAGFVVAWVFYVARPRIPEDLARRFAAAYRALVDKFYVDELYDRTVVRPLVRVSDEVLFRGVDAGLIDGVGVNGSARAVRALADHGLRHLQSGLAQSYLWLMVAGTLAIVALLLR
jgi:NADH-quinone oxidoreductase subunit L